MSRHFYTISFAMMLMVFTTGQRGCIEQIAYDQASDLFNNSGCLASCVGDCGSCDECISDCAACDECMSECGCDGCAITRIPGTYTADSISNAVQVRLSASGISFIEEMLAPRLGPTLNPMLGTIFDEPVADERVCVGYNYRIRICDPGARDAQGCGINLDLKTVSLDSQPRPGNTPDELVLRIAMDLKPVTVLNNGNVVGGWLSRQRSGAGFGCDIAYWGDWGNCTVDVGLAQNASEGVTFEARFSLGTSGVAPRADINTIQLVEANLLGLDANLSGCTVGNLAGILPGDMRQQIVKGVTDAIMDRVPQIIRTALCENRNNLIGDDGTQGVCPAGTNPFNYSYGIAQLGSVPGCGQNANACLPILLGLEGRLDASALLSALAPGFTAIVDFIVAASGGATTPNNGLSVWLKGGLASSSGHSHCVPALDPAEIPSAADVPRAAVFEGNSHPSAAGWEPSVMVGVSEQFVNRAAYELWSSGALCLQISSATLPMLDPALVGILFASDLKNLVFPASDSDSPLGVGLRPQKPPTIRFDNAEGGGVKVGVAMPELQLDFYAWSLDRYVRFVTFQLDIDIAVAVKANAGKIQLDLLGVDITNTRALNDSLISNGGSAANLITGVVGSLLPAFLGDSGPLFEFDVAGILDDFDPIEVPGMGEIPLPLSIELRDDALAAVYTNASGATIPARDENGHAFLGVFVDLAGGTGGGGSGLTAAVDTQVDITSVYIPEDKSAFAAETFGQGELPRVEFVMSASAPAGVPVEYRYRLGLGGWSEWQDSPYGVIEDPLLLLQQEHTIFARARVKGEPRTEDRSSAKARFSTDVTPPMVDITAEAKGIRIQAVDFHTRASELEYRFREPEGEFSEWAKLGPEATALIDASRDVEVEVRDAAGNVASNVAELRGLPPSSAAAGGCSCSAAGPVSGSSNSLLGFLAMVAMVGGMMYRLRRREEKV